MERTRAEGEVPYQPDVPRHLAPDLRDLCALAAAREKARLKAHGHTQAAVLEEPAQPEPGAVDPARAHRSWCRRASARSRGASGATGSGHPHGSAHSRASARSPTRGGHHPPLLDTHFIIHYYEKPDSPHPNQLPTPHTSH